MKKAKDIKLTSLADTHLLLSQLYSELLAARTDRERFELENEISEAHTLLRMLTTESNERRTKL